MLLNPFRAREWKLAISAFSPKCSVQRPGVDRHQHRGTIGALSVKLLGAISSKRRVALSSPFSGNIATGEKRLKRDKLRSAATVLLVVMQVNLVCVAGFHRHAEPQPLGTRANTFQKGTRQTQPTPESSDVCVVCQIVRHGAARPETVAPTPHPTAADPFALPVARSTFHSYQPAVRYGRAPPLV